MSKAVLISIRPKWCELIASREKTIEVRKTRPKQEPPFKCYIYCTKDPGNKGSATHFFESDEGTFWSAGKTFAAFLSGTVIGEFMCDRIIDWHYIPDPDESADPGSMAYDVLTVDGEKTGLEYDEFEDYGKGAPLFGWHISNLVIYDEPKKLSEFRRHDPTYDFSVFGEVCRTYSIQRPHQSWCYIEELP